MALAAMAADMTVPAELREKLRQLDWQALIEAIFGLTVNGSGVHALVFSMMREDHLRANAQRQSKPTDLPMWTWRSCASIYSHGGKLQRVPTESSTISGNPRLARCPRIDRVFRQPILECVCLVLTRDVLTRAHCQRHDGQRGTDCAAPKRKQLPSVTNRFLTSQLWL